MAASAFDANALTYMGQLFHEAMDAEFRGRLDRIAELHQRTEELSDAMAITLNQRGNCRWTVPEGFSENVFVWPQEGGGGGTFNAVDPARANNQRVAAGLIEAYGGHDFNDACERAERLLKSWLSPSQLAEYQKKMSFTVIGSDTGTTYRIAWGQMVEAVAVVGLTGAPVRYCFMPEDFLVPGDVMLAQKLALENAEHKTLNVANRF